MKTTKIIVVLNIGNRIKLNQSENKNKNKKKFTVVVKTEYDEIQYISLIKLVFFFIFWYFTKKSKKKKIHVTHCIRSHLSTKLTNPTRRKHTIHSLTHNHKHNNNNNNHFISFSFILYSIGSVHFCYFTTNLQRVERKKSF